MPSGLIMMYVRSVSNLPAKTARFPRGPALAATDLSARSATASATERMERRAAELVLEAGAINQMFERETRREKNLEARQKELRNEAKRAAARAQQDDDGKAAATTSLSLIHI